MMTVTQQQSTALRIQRPRTIEARAWRHRLVSIFLVLDALAAVIGVAAASLIRFGTSPAEVAGGDIAISYGAVGALFVVSWVALLAAAGTFDPRKIGAGPDEYRAVFTASVRFLALAAVASYLGQFSLSRAYLALSLVVTLVFSLVLRHLARKWLLRQRASGRFGDDLLIVGSVETVASLVRHFRRSAAEGYFVLGAVVEGGLLALDVDGEPVPVFGAPRHVQEILTNTQAHAVAIADPNTLREGQLRQLAWHLEGTGVDLLVAPAITDFAGPRINVRPAAGLPLLHVEEPRLGGTGRVLKEGFDRTMACALLLVTAPLFALAALAIRLDSRGPVFFRQSRVGRGGEAFTCWKFRTMYDGADAQKAALADLNEHDGVLFKIRHDPRRTPVGRVLRRLSIDELPQLVNVIRGDMSIVGPRPPVHREVEKYGDDMRRRLLVKPGLTGLWQVSGRADLKWDESVRLDLYYVENWSMALDMAILWRTAAAVVRGRGAY